MTTEYRLPGEIISTSKKLIELLDIELDLQPDLNIEKFTKITLEELITRKEKEIKEMYELEFQE
tara:strand:- start:359 stop:550 length:192 start_codon:yes stop_codon:yes gene_type:complete